MLNKKKLLFMKRFYFILVCVLILILLVGCSKDVKNKDFKTVESEKVDDKAKNLKKSAIFRIKNFARYKNNVNFMAILLENGDKFCLRQPRNEIYNWLFLEKGDTIVYRDNQIIGICWKN